MELAASYEQIDLLELKFQIENAIINLIYTSTTKDRMIVVTFLKLLQV
jgi:hypothetical protein